jgi:hypothetical protein
MEYLKQFETIFAIFLGWLLSLLTMVFSERIRHPYRRRDLIQAVVDEMLGLQYTLATAPTWYGQEMLMSRMLFSIRSCRSSKVTTGRIGAMTFRPALKRLRGVSEQERAATLQSKTNSNVGMALRQYSIPLFATQIADLAICSRDFQRSVLRIRYHLDLYNQLVAYTQSLFEKTYNKPSPEDRVALIANQKRGYREAGVRAEIIVQMIRDLRKRYGSTKT